MDAQQGCHVAFACYARGICVTRHVNLVAGLTDLLDGFEKLLCEFLFATWLVKG